MRWWVKNLNKTLHSSKPKKTAIIFYNSAVGAYLCFIIFYCLSLLSPPCCLDCLPLTEHYRSWMLNYEMEIQQKQKKGKSTERIFVAFYYSSKRKQAQKKNVGCWNINNIIKTSCSASNLCRKLFFFCIMTYSNGTLMCVICNDFIFASFASEQKRGF